MSRLGRTAGKAACTTPEQARVQKNRQMLQKIRMNLSEARYDATYETSDTLVQMQEALTKRMEGKINNPGGQTQEELEEECTKTASATLEQMKQFITKAKPGEDATDASPSPTTPDGFRGRIGSSPCVSNASRKAPSVHRPLRATGSGVHMAVAEVHAVQDDD